MISDESVWADLCIHELVAAQVEKQPDAIAVVYQGQQLSYRELDDRANRLANHLASIGVGPETAVGICVERSLEMVVGVLGIVKAGGYYVPLDPSYPAERLAWMLNNTSASVLLTQQHLLSIFPEPPTQVLFLDQELSDCAGHPRQIFSDQLANVLYTSGSTGKPKGIAMSHRSLSRILEWQIRRLPCGSGTRTAQFSPLSFDMSFLEIFSMLCCGGTLVILSDTLRRDPAALWEFLIDEQIEVLFVPLAALHQLAQVSLKQAAGPTQLRAIASSGEQLYITPEVVQLFERLKGVELDNLYGPTESHVAMEFRLEGPPHAWPNRPPIGRSLVHTQIYLLDENLNFVPPDAEGEIFIGGSGLARGYLGRPDLTSERFLPDPFSNEPGSRMYRTGDRARVQADGVLEFLGRIDHQVKIRGFRVEPEEIESELTKHPSIRSAAVVALDDANGDKRLAAYFVCGDNVSVSTSELRHFLQAELPAFMIPAVFVPMDALPVSPNGKLDRRALPLPETVRPALDTEFVAPRNSVEQELARIWAGVLGVGEVGINDNFFELGGHSLLAAKLLARLHELLGREISMRTLFEAPTIAGLTATINQPEGDAGSRLPQVVPDPKRWHEPFPLADMQQAYWLGRSEEFELGGVATHVYVEVEVGEVDLEQVETVVQRLIQRHGMLRAVILPDGRQQLLADVPPYKIRVTDLRGANPAHAQAELENNRTEVARQIRPAHEWPWFEVRASLLDDRRTRFHIGYDLLIGDLRSMQILISEFMQLFRNPETTLSELEFSFRDYVVAETTLQNEDLFKRAKTYWQERLKALPPAPDLPLAKHPGSISNPHFVRRSAKLSADKWRQIKAQATRHNLTPAVVVLTAYAEILTTWSASPRFTINLPIQNRLPVHPQVNDVVGEFTSISLLTIDNTSASNFVERAELIQKQLWEDLSHRHYSGTRVMRDLAHAQGASSVVMPVVFTSALNREMSGWITGAAEEVVYSAIQTPQVWLDHQVGEHEGVLNFNWDAVEGLFPDRVIDDMFESFCRRLSQLAESDESWIETEAIPLPAAQLEQRSKINDTTVALEPTLLHTPFVEQARQHPERLAVVSATRNLTYGELDHGSNAIAGILTKLQVPRGKLVAVVMEKGWEQVAGVLGILKAGAAYVPIDPQLPEARRLSLLEDAEVDVVLTQPWLAETLRWPERVRLEIVDWNQYETVVISRCEEGRQWDELAYVIYTSGSTGFPKGVMIDHRGAVNTILDINRRFKITAADRVLALSSLSFDLSVYDIFGTLAAGGTLVMPDAEGARDPSKWVELIATNGVTVWNTVPALMEMLVEYLADRSEGIPDQLRTIMLSGDWIPVTLPGKIRKLFKGVDIFSLGGATEASIWSILHRIEETDSLLPSIPYGSPMANQSFNVLNEKLELCPVWVKGELYIGGIGLSRGYWHDEEKTRAHFITHPRTGERLYKTGDLGRYLPGGEIEFLGRKDSQVKLQGFRIELGEIEATLLQHPSVRSAVVVVCGETNDSKRLVGFVVVEEPVGPSVLREFLRERLARHMIPSDLVVVDEIPITANGKIDRKALLKLEPAVTKVEAPRVSTVTNTERVLASIFEELLGIDHVDTEANFFDLGANSLHIVRAHNRLRSVIDENVPIVLFFKHPSIKALVNSLKQQSGVPAVEPEPCKSFRPTHRGPGVSSDVAVIGMSCRFPGAPNLDQFWNNLRDGVDSLVRLTDEELLSSGISKDLLSRPDFVKAGAVLEGIELFDAGFFGMSPREAELTDPQQRIFLEVAWEGLEDAGYDPQQYPGSIGVFAGANLSTYLLFNLDTRIANSVAGWPILLNNDKDYLATHVSYKLNLRGPSMSIQTACSTSLVAIHMACQSLLNGECDIALAGGITINVPQKTGYQYQQGGPVSPDGHCRSFSADALGTVFGNGVGVVVLKRLRDALRDGDCIDAVVKGSAINNDGAAKVGFTAPSVEGQAMVIAQALARAGVEPEEIGYVEAHGTATPLGDPIEVAALSLAYTSASSALRPASVALGSVKSNVGHLDSAAGVAGFIKTVLSLKHQQLVPSLHCATPNPQIDFGSTPFYVNTALQPWVVGPSHSRRAGVSSFGIGGTNAHLVLEEAPPAIAPTAATVAQTSVRSMTTEISQGRAADQASLYLLPLSARHPQALAELARAYRNLLLALPQTPVTPERAVSLALRDLCYSASLRRAHHPAHRLAVLGRSPGELARHLEAFLDEQPLPQVFSSAALGRGRPLGAAPRVVFVFSGQGPQWWAMGRQLLATSRVFREAITECDELLAGNTERWRLLTELTASEADSRLDGEQIEITQCAVFALQVGLARLWESYGLRPWAVIGHSKGEVAAAVASGGLTMAEGVRVIYQRSRLLQAAVDQWALGKGAMAAVELGEAEAEAVVASYGGRVSVAAINGRRSSVISGAAEAVRAVVRQLEEREVMAREVHTNGVAGHSWQVAGVAEELRLELGGLCGRESGVMMVSTVTGDVIGGAGLNGEYWARNLREQVRFQAGMKELRRRGAEVYVEMNAHPVLGLWIREGAEGRDGGAAEDDRGGEEGGESGVVVIGALRRDREDREVTLEGLAEVYAAGVEVRWDEVWREGEVGAGASKEEDLRPRYVRLPGYAWQRQPFWIEEGEAVRVTEKASRLLARGHLKHPLLGQRLSSPLLKDFVFESWFSVSTTDFFDDHRVYEAPVMSATTYVELAMAAAAEAFGQSARAVEDVIIQEAMMFPDGEGRVVQVLVSGEDEGAAAFQIFSRPDGEDDAWSLHVTGNIGLAHKRGVDARHEHSALESLRARFSKELPLEILARRIRAGGVSYGPSFQGIEKIWHAKDEALGYIALPELSEAEKYYFHPALLDLCLQVVEAARADEVAEDDCYLPLSLERFRSFARPDKALWSYAYIHPERSRETFGADIVVFNADGEVIGEVEGLRFKRANKETLLRGRRERLEDRLYELQWTSPPLSTNGHLSFENKLEGSQIFAESGGTVRNGRGLWLIVAESDGFVESLAERLKARGGQTVLISPGELYQVNNGGGTINPTTPEPFSQVINQHLNHDRAVLRGVVYLCAAETSSAPEVDAVKMLRLMESCCEGALRVSQALINASVKQMARLWLVTRGAQQFAATPSPAAIAQAALWGLGRTVALEHPELKVSLVDMSESASDDDKATLLLGELLGDGGGEQVCFRGLEKYVARLARSKRQDVPPTQISLRADATYLITGGLGGIGLKLSRWMVERGARHLVLTGRSGASLEAREVLSKLEDLGAEVLVAQADVADREQMTAVLRKISSQMPPLRGIFHLALVLDDGVLAQQDVEKFRKVLSPKAAGAWNLHLLTRDVPLDYFVLFSSVLSVLGGSGQGNYTAASAFVDALAHYRRAAGLPAMSINWGPWSYEGSASAEVIEQHTQLYDGFTSISPEHGLEALGRLLHLDDGQIGVMPFDWREWIELYPAAGATLLAQLAAETPAHAQPSRYLKNKPALTNEALFNAEASQREGLLRAYLHGIVARRLGVLPSTFGVEDTFISLGLDSLMTLEIRNRIVDDIGLTISPVKFIENPTIAQLTAALYERWREVYEPVEETIEQDELLARLALLSDEEVDSSLRNILATS